ncbi:hypothetical protein [Deinococcus sp.]|uniref:hypothetical protein n=1 Tax=Deinococcus sp. TaxID=47478 RepID=UPI003C7AFB85
MVTLSKNTESKTAFPQVSLQHALESAFQIYEAEPGSRAVPEDRFRRRLGYDRTNGNSVRLIVGMRDYGLIERRKSAYTLTTTALDLFTANDLPEFRAGLYRAAMLPELMGELLARYGTKLDTRELDDDLRSRRVADRDRKIIRTVLRDNEELIRSETRATALYGRFQAITPRRARPGVFGWLGGTAFWMRSLPGRTANLTLVALLFVGSLLYFSLRPGPAGVVTVQRAPHPVPAASGGSGGSGGAASPATLSPGTGLPGVRLPGAGAATGTASSAANGALLGTLLTATGGAAGPGSALSASGNPAAGGAAPTATVSGTTASGAAASGAAAAGTPRAPVAATLPGVAPAGLTTGQAGPSRPSTRQPDTSQSSANQPDASQSSSQPGVSGSSTRQPGANQSGNGTGGTLGAREAGTKADKQPAQSTGTGTRGPAGYSAESTPAAAAPPTGTYTDGAPAAPPSKAAAPAQASSSGGAATGPSPTKTQAGSPAVSPQETAPTSRPAASAARPAPVKPTTSLTTAAPGSARPSTETPQDLMARGQQLAALLYSQNLTPLWDAFTPPLRAQWNGFSAFEAYRMGGLETYGAETRVVSEELRESGGVTYYVRTSTFERGPGTAWSLILGLNPAGQVVEFNIVAAEVLPGVATSSVR